MSKTALINDLTTKTGLSKGQVSEVLDALAAVGIDALKAGDEFTIPGLVKISTKAKPATEERMGINPFTKATITIAAKPASKTIKAKPLPALKKAVG